mmetsp:Transcript_18769/g.33671  ORF Transcript_18769/g.33671 Transcript_18769/m.33671 type:complete len:144 (+) Transcript_18769:940-1371(+)|eukprot:CAMPEP_0196131952 /NCGR_PEP_ID=MMETSP0910-20130528/1749_1 /TAXON_ID=49265 /ORGANISM="Thalassiosira rotula, Strain GSO102" /LENGTH=143 /DNA_ID=CAMNT_0041391479 /DNA_START=2027 /DNA_END=2458 /DNA_ORIENTATION=-
MTPSQEFGDWTVLIPTKCIGTGQLGPTPFGEITLPGAADLDHVPMDPVKTTGALAVQRTNIMLPLLSGRRRLVHRTFALSSRHGVTVTPPALWLDDASPFLCRVGEDDTALNNGGALEIGMTFGVILGGWNAFRKESFIFWPI